VAEFLAAVPDAPVACAATGFDIGDEAYAAIVKRVITDEIGRGEGANFVIRRDFHATIAGYSPATAVTLFRRLLAAETGAYWTFAVHTGDLTLAGATPERHVSAAGGTVQMNPISGTYRYPRTGPRLDGVLRFLADRKETEELYMVVDEELKMMSEVCDLGGQVHGPYLKEMGHLAHTEYVLEGRSDRDVREILRGTMFAATVTGSPVPNACRIIAEYEPSGRGYYAATLALFGRDEEGSATLDSPILIRTLHLSPGGEVTLPVAATLVRHSDPHSEVAETHAKAAGVLAALGLRSAVARHPGGIAADPAVVSALAARNRDLSGFWLRPQVAEPATGTRALVVEAGDGWAAMLAHLLRILGLAAEVRRWDDLPPMPGYDLVVAGPGPGDPRDLADPKMAALDALVAGLLAGGRPLLAVCLSHQVLCGRLGLDLFAKDQPFQGTQREIDLFGHREKVGFYNSFAARVPAGATSLEIAADPVTGEVHALRGPGFASVQFHAESILTTDGPAILRRLLADLL
ncbi:MAG: 2-amino-4-deoxychorismate synthase, partial [Cryptosporangiaceae bacterium]|nr:2-amino-4-deoxychorismate synthase [Cryptosporangiaceae bacterium]